MTRLQGVVQSLVRLACVLALLGVVVLSLTPVEHLPPQVFDLWDKAQHAFGFAVLAVLGVLAYPRRPVGWVLGLLALGAGIEVAQSLTGWRYGDMADWVADAAGVVVGLPLGWALHSAMQRLGWVPLQR